MSNWILKLLLILCTATAWAENGGSRKHPYLYRGKVNISTEEPLSDVNQWVKSMIEHTEDVLRRAEEEVRSRMQSEGFSGEQIHLLPMQITNVELMPLHRRTRFHLPLLGSNVPSADAVMPRASVEVGFIYPKSIPSKYFKQNAVESLALVVMAHERTGEIRRVGEVGGMTAAELFGNQTAITCAALWGVQKSITLPESLHKQVEQIVATDFSQHFNSGASYRLFLEMTTSSEGVVPIELGVIAPPRIVTN